MTNHRLRVQLEEAYGPDNQWFCSQAFGHKIEDPETLLKYFIKSGGAIDFAARYAQAMGQDNRWFCSQFHRRQIDDEETLWSYYMSYCRPARLCLAS